MLGETRVRLSLGQNSFEYWILHELWSFFTHNGDRNCLTLHDLLISLPINAALYLISIQLNLEGVLCSSQVLSLCKLSLLLLFSVNCGRFDSPGHSAHLFKLETISLLPRVPLLALHLETFSVVGAEVKFILFVSIF